MPGLSTSNLWFKPSYNFFLTQCFSKNIYLVLSMKINREEKVTLACL